MVVVKRDGRKSVFDRSKIEYALYSAYVATVHEDTNDDSFKNFAETVSGFIEDKALKRNEPFTVEEIQDILEKKLMDSKYKDVARSYITYRNERTSEREKKSSLMSAIRGKLQAKDIENQNANVDEHSFGGRMGEARSIVAKEYALNECMSKKSKYNHLNNIIYQHDLDSFAVGEHNCLTIPYDSLLEGGFNTRQTDVRPAMSINTAMQLVAVLFQLQSLQQFGGVAAGHLDFTMVPYIRHSLFKHYIMECIKESDDFDSLDILNMEEDEFDEWLDEHKKEYLEARGLSEDDFYIGSDKLDNRLYRRALFETRKETYQAVEGMYHNLNTLQSRSGNQLPFTSINYGLCTIPEGRLVTKALLETSIKGIGKLNKTSIFPCGIFQYKKGVNDKKGAPNYDLYRLALKSTAKRLYPNYCNCDWSVDLAGFRGDRADKEAILSILDSKGMKALVDWVEKNPKESKILGLYIDTDGDRKVAKVVDYQLPCEFSATMGCSSGSETISVAIDDYEYKNIKIEYAFFLIKGCKYGKENVEFLSIERSEYISCENLNVSILSGNKYVSLKGILVNSAENSNPIVHLTYLNASVEKVLKVTIDHPLSVFGRGRVEVKDINIGDCLIDSVTGELYPIVDKIVSKDKYPTYDVETANDMFDLSGILSHNCRTYNGRDINFDGFEKNINNIISVGKPFDIDCISSNQKDGRGNICPVTVILPEIAMMARKKLGISLEDITEYSDELVSTFLDLLEIYIEEAKDSLIERYELICSQPMESAKFMYENKTMSGYVSGEGIVSALKHGTLALGQLGLAETLQILIGKDHTTDEGMDLAKKIEALFKKKCAEYKVNYHLNIGVYYTPRFLWAA